MFRSGRPFALLIAGLLVAAGIATSSPAVASSSGADTAKPPVASELTVTIAACNYGLGQPFKLTGVNIVSAYGWSWGCDSGWQFTLRLQRSRWWGWENMATRSWRGDRTERADTPCAGTHDYRSWLTIVNPAGVALPSLRSVNVRLSCD